MLRYSKLSAVFLALTVALGGCTEGSGTGVDDAPFDPEESAADLQVVQGAFDASMFESLNAASPTFNQVADTLPSSAPAMVQAGWAAATTNSRWEAQALAQSLAAAGPANGPLLRSDLLGRTYERVGDDYRHNSDRTGAPADGVRFILYAKDPVTGAQTGDEVGHVDLIDESEGASLVARVIVVTGGVEHINYTVSATLLIGDQSLSFAVLGFISDGTDRVDVDLSMTFVTDEPVSTATVEHVIGVPTRDFELDATAVMTFNSETLQGSIDVDATFAQGAHTVAVDALVEFGEGDNATESGTVNISVDGALFAVVTVTENADGVETVTVTNGAGGELTAAEATAVRKIFDAFEDLFDDRFEDFIRPVNWMFDF